MVSCGVLPIPKSLTQGSKNILFALSTKIIFKVFNISSVLFSQGNRF